MAALEHWLSGDFGGFDARVLMEFDVFYDPLESIASFAEYVNVFGSKCFQYDETWHGHVFEVSALKLDKFALVFDPFPEPFPCLWAAETPPRLILGGASLTGWDQTHGRLVGPYLDPKVFHRL